jgi:hypothetical protein
MSSFSIPAKQLGIIFILLNLIPSIFAFQATSLQISVIDQKNAFISETTVRIKSKDGLVKDSKTTKNQAIFFSKITTGKYILEVQAKGFRPHSQEIEITSGKNEISIKLEVAEIVENVEVTRDKQETATEDVFSNFLTRQSSRRPRRNGKGVEKSIRARCSYQS